MIQKYQGLARYLVKMRLYKRNKVEDCVKISPTTMSVSRGQGPDLLFLRYLYAAPHALFSVGLTAEWREDDQP